MAGTPRVFVREGEEREESVKKERKRNARGHKTNIAENGFCSGARLCKKPDESLKGGSRETRKTKNATVRAGTSRVILTLHFHS